MAEVAEAIESIAAAIVDAFGWIPQCLGSHDLEVARWWVDVVYVEVFALPDPETDKAPARVVRCDGTHEDTMVTREQWDFLDPEERRAPCWWAKVAPSEWAVRS